MLLLNPIENDFAKVFLSFFPLPDLYVVYKYIIHKLHINTFPRILIIEDVLCEACFSGAHLCKEFIIRFFDNALSHSTIIEW